MQLSFSKVNICNLRTNIHEYLAFRNDWLIKAKTTLIVQYHVKGHTFNLYNRYS